jgi:hypothetical protein
MKWPDDLVHVGEFSDVVFRREARRLRAQMAFQALQAVLAVACLDTAWADNARIVEESQEFSYCGSGSPMLDDVRFTWVKP